METSIIINSGILIVIGVWLFLIFRQLRKGKGSKTEFKSYQNKFTRKYYRFHNGLVACQEQLGLDQNEEFAVLLERAVKGENEELTMELLNKMLYGDGGMRELLCIILINPDGAHLTEAQALLANKLKEDEVEDVLNDFFILNPKKKALFDLLKAAAVSRSLMTPTKPDGT